MKKLKKPYDGVCTVENSTTSPHEIKNQKMIRNALRLRMRFKSYEEIGKTLNVTSGTAYNLVKKGLEEMPRENAEELRSCINATYQELISQTKVEALRGDNFKASILIKAMEKLSILEGLNVVTTKKIDVNNFETTIGNGLSVDELNLPLDVKKQILNAVREAESKKKEIKQ